MNFVISHQFLRVVDHRIIALVSTMLEDQGKFLQNLARPIILIHTAAHVNSLGEQQAAWFGSKRQPFLLDVCTYTDD